jgi:nitronate monooxygenase
LALGAQGALIGTAFLATEESYAHNYHKLRIVNATPGQTVHTKAFHINWPAGAAVRVLPNSVTKGDHGDPFATARQVIGAEGERAIYLFSTDSPLRSTIGNLEAMALYAGEGSGRLGQITSAAERLNSIAAGARAALPAKPPVLSDEAEAPESSSPVCYASEADDAYMGFADAAELASELNILLEAERAGARVAARIAADAPDAELKALARVIHADEVKWCRALFRALTELTVEPSKNVGAFYENAMAIEGIEARLAFVNRGQGWVVRKLRALVPRIRDAALHGVLAEMLRAHEVNIASANEALARRAAPTASPA